MGREYIPPFFLLGVMLMALAWFELYAKPRLRRELWDKEDAERRATAEPESHSKSSE
jgi:hypothetical protein